MLRRIIIPLVKPGIIAGSILVFIPSLGAYVTPRVLGGGKNMMLGNLIELQFGQGRNWPLGAALSIALMLIVMVALLVYVRKAGASGAAPWLSGAFSVRRQPGFTADRDACLRPALRCRSSMLVIYSFNAGDLARGLGGLSLRWYRGGLAERARSSRPRPPLAADRDRRRACSRRSPPRWRRSPRRARRPIAA